MKSSYELAMERLNKKSPTAKVSVSQKKELADLDSLYASKIAEREIFITGEIEKAMQKGEYETVIQLQKQLISDRKSLSADLEEKKKKCGGKDILGMDSGCPTPDGKFGVNMNLTPSAARQITILNSEIITIPPLTVAAASVTSTGSKRKLATHSVMPPKSDKADKAEKNAEKAAAAGHDGPRTAASRQRDLDAAISSITKAYGDGSIMRLGSSYKVDIDVIPTGSLAIDIALGVGGIPRGRVVEIFGPESSGKTTLMLHVIANAQKAGGLAAFIDAEHALDPGYARKLGVNLDELLVSQPNSGEEALTICETLARSNALDVIVIDSVAALVPKAELEGEMGMATMGMQARLMSQALRKLTAILSKAKTACIFTNQMREKVGVMFGNPETTPAGKHSSFMLRCAWTSAVRKRSRMLLARRSAIMCGSRSSKTRWHLRLQKRNLTSCSIKGSTVNPVF